MKHKQNSVGGKSDSVEEWGGIPVIHLIFVRLSTSRPQTEALSGLKGFL